MALQWQSRSVSLSNSQAIKKEMQRHFLQLQSSSDGSKNKYPNQLQK
jgi:hypothetical protein